MGNGSLGRFGFLSISDSHYVLGLLSLYGALEADGLIGHEGAIWSPGFLPSFGSQYSFGFLLGSGSLVLIGFLTGPVHLQAHWVSMEIWCTHDRGMLACMVRLYPMGFSAH